MSIFAEREMYIYCSLSAVSVVLHSEQVVKIASLTGSDLCRQCICFKDFFVLVFFVFFKKQMAELQDSK